MMELHGIRLDAADEAAVRQGFEKNGGYVKYKDVLQHV